MRALMEHEFGIKPSDIEWVQGRPDRFNHKMPPEVHRTMAQPGVELGDMLERGEIDFMICANNPLSFRRGSPKVQRLFPDYTAMEKDYCRRTNIYPIMHAIVIRRDVYDRYPWTAASLYKALCKSKDLAYLMIEEMGTPKSSFAWLQGLLEEEKSIIGPDWFPYGVERNRVTLEAALQYTYEQGLTERRIQIDELFSPSCMRDIPLSEGQLV
jgi:4,5-dihydroxyphthalate decarboxylase